MTDSPLPTGTDSSTCGHCPKKVFKGIFCELCEKWYHIKCGKLTQAQYEALESIPSAAFFCHKCRTNNALKKLKDLVASSSIRSEARSPECKSPFSPLPPVSQSQCDTSRVFSSNEAFPVTVRDEPSQMPVREAVVTLAQPPSVVDISREETEHLDACKDKNDRDDEEEREKQVRIVQGHTDPLSNFWPFPMRFQGQTAMSLEHHYHAIRAMRSGKGNLALDILASKHAGDAKRLSRFIPKTRRTEDLKLMQALLMAKAEQCPKFRADLRACEAKRCTFVHCTRKDIDLFWASGLDPKDNHQRGYPGYNLHGHLLHIVLASLRPEEEYMKAPPPLLKQPILESGPVPLLPELAGFWPLPRSHPQGPAGQYLVPPIRQMGPQPETSFWDGVIPTLGARHLHGKCSVCGIPGHNEEKCRHRVNGIECFCCGKKRS
ncbi:MAG: NADAR domain-containing protein [Bacteroidota bacterium]